VSHCLHAATAITYWLWRCY